MAPNTLGESLQQVKDHRALQRRPGLHILQRWSVSGIIIVGAVVSALPFATSTRSADGAVVGTGERAIAMFTKNSRVVETDDILMQPKRHVSLAGTSDAIGDSKDMSRVVLMWKQFMSKIQGQVQESALAKLKHAYDVIPNRLSFWQKQEVREAFALIDRDASHSITDDQLQIALRAWGFGTDTEQKRKELQLMLSKVEHDEDDEITFDAFLKLVTDTIVHLDPQHEFKKSFRWIDFNQSGKISFKKLRRAVRESGMQASQEDIHKMIVYADMNGDGFVSEQEFLDVLNQFVSGSPLKHSTTIKY